MQHIRCGFSTKLRSPDSPDSEHQGFLTSVIYWLPGNSLSFTEAFRVGLMDSTFTSAFISKLKKKKKERKTGRMWRLRRGYNGGAKWRLFTWTGTQGCLAMTLGEATTPPGEVPVAGTGLARFLVWSQRGTAGCVLWSLRAKFCLPVRVEGVRTRGTHNRRVMCGRRDPGHRPQGLSGCITGGPV